MNPITIGRNNMVTGPIDFTAISRKQLSLWCDRGVMRDKGSRPALYIEHISNKVATHTTYFKNANGKRVRVDKKDLDLPHRISRIEGENFELSPGCVVGFGVEGNFPFRVEWAPIPFAHILVLPLLSVGTEYGASASDSAKFAVNAMIELQKNWPLKGRCGVLFVLEERTYGAAVDSAFVELSPHEALYFDAYYDSDKAVIRSPSEKVGFELPLRKLVLAGHEGSLGSRSALVSLHNLMELLGDGACNGVKALCLRANRGFVMSSAVPDAFLQTALLDEAATSKEQKWADGKGQLACFFKAQGTRVRSATGSLVMPSIGSVFSLPASPTSFSISLGASLVEGAFKSSAAPEGGGMEECSPVPLTHVITALCPSLVLGNLNNPPGLLPSSSSSSSISSSTTTSLNKHALEAILEILGRCYSLVVREFIEACKQWEENGGKPPSTAATNSAVENSVAMARPPPMKTLEGASKGSTSKAPTSPLEGPNPLLKPYRGWVGDGESINWGGQGRLGGSFKDALHVYAANPGEYYDSGCILMYDKDWVAVRDRYPKALRHCLVIPRKGCVLENVKGISELQPRHIAGLEAMGAFGRALEAAVLKELGESQGHGGGAHPVSSPLWMGFHSTPSLTPLHLHVISQDLAGECLTKRAHYNSFSSPFFIPLSSIIEILGNPEGGTAAAISELIARVKEKKYAKHGACHLCAKVGVPDSESGKEEWGAFKRHLALCSSAHTFLPPRR